MIEKPWQGQNVSFHWPIDCIADCVPSKCVISIQMIQFAGTLRVEITITSNYIIIRIANDKSKTVIFNIALHLFFEIWYDSLYISQRT